MARRAFLSLALVVGTVFSTMTFAQGRLELLLNVLQETVNDLGKEDRSEELRENILKRLRDAEITPNMHKDTFEAVRMGTTLVIERHEWLLGQLMYLVEQKFEDMGVAYSMLKVTKMLTNVTPSEPCKMFMDLKKPLKKTDIN